MNSLFGIGRVLLAGTPLEPLAAQWAGRVVANGGARPGAATVRALSEFVAGLRRAGLLDAMKALNVIAPDNLVAACTPLIKVAGNDPWTNNNFVAGDLTVNGLKGNASTKYLNTGVIPGTDMAAASGGVTIYIKETAAENAVDIGAQATSSNLLQIWGQYSSGDTYFHCWNGTNNQGQVFAANAGFTGLLTGNRTAANAFAIHKANGATALTAVASGATTGGSPPAARPLFLFATNASGTPLQYSSKRMSFAAAHLGLTAAQAAALYELVQLLRQRLGGGWV